MARAVQNHFRGGGEGLLADLALVVDERRRPLLGHGFTVHQRQVFLQQMSPPAVRSAVFTLVRFRVHVRHRVVHQRLPVNKLLIAHPGNARKLVHRLQTGPYLI